MKVQFSVFLFFLVVFATCCCLQAKSEEQNEVQVEAAGRSSLVPPKLFDFGRFKTMFKKKYGSVMEEVARKKLFFARAFRAFLSFISYKHYKSSSFLKISEMSDWTNAELRAIEVRRPVEESEAAPQRNSASDGVESVADLDEIESELKQLVSEHKNEPGYSEIVAELNLASKRRKRNVGSTRSELTVNDLFEQDLGEKPTSSNVVSRVPSNNPDYQQPELTSFGSEDNSREPEPMSDWQSKLIVSIPGVKYISSLLSDAKKSLLGNTEPVTILRTDLQDEIFVDHRESRCFTPVRSQGQCGSCYIFSTMALYEYIYCRETGKLAEFSEQYALDCGERVGMKGCSGGLEMDVSKFFGTYGIELRSSYPYRMRVDSCPYDDHTPSKRMGYLKVVEPKLKTIPFTDVDKYLAHTPVLMGFAVSNDFHAYGGGVDLGGGCDRTRGHSMLVIGSGREDGVEYYLVRNSYGRNWGISGHYKIAKLATNCYLDRGIGWVLQPKNGRVFGSVNTENDGSYVRDHVYTNEQNSIPDWLRNSIYTLNTDIATPAPEYVSYYS